MSDCLAPQLKDFWGRCLVTFPSFNLSPFLPLMLDPSIWLMTNSWLWFPTPTADGVDIWRRWNPWDIKRKNVYSIWSCSERRSSFPSTLSLMMGHCSPSHRERWAESLSHSVYNTPRWSLGEKTRILFHSMVTVAGVVPSDGPVHALRLRLEQMS